MENETDLKNSCKIIDVALESVGFEFENVNSICELKPVGISENSGKKLDTPFETKAKTDRSSELKVKIENDKKKQKKSVISETRNKTSTSEPLSSIIFIRNAFFKEDALDNVGVKFLRNLFQAKVVVKKLDSGTTKIVPVKKDNDVKKRKIFTLQEKTQILDDIRSGRSKAELCEERGLKHSTLAKWIKDEFKIRDALINDDVSRKKFRPIKHDDDSQLGEPLVNWYSKCYNDNVPPAGDMLREKALENCSKVIASKDNFMESDNWLGDCKTTYGIADFPEVTEEASRGDKNENFSRRQIFKCDWTALRYRSLPKNKLPDDAVTIMTCSNADGSLKLPLVISGKFDKSKTLINLQSKLPMLYVYQPGEQVGSEALSEWVHSEFTSRVTDFLIAENLPLKAVLIAESELVADAFQNRPMGELQVHLTLLHNLSLTVGPTNNQLTHSVKMNYEYKLLRSIISAQNDGEDLNNYLKRITLRDFVYWICSSWDEVETSTIVRSWRKIIAVNETDPASLESEQETTDGKVLETLRQIREYIDFSEDDLVKWLRDNSNEEAENTLKNQTL